MIIVGESETKCIQYQEEIDKLQKEIEKYKIDLEIKEKCVNESKYFEVNIVLYYTILF